MDDPPENIDSLLDCLENWDSPGTRQCVERKLAANPGASRILAEQRTMDLALRARAGRDASHDLLREKILLSVQEQAAPAAMRESIFSAVQAEARRSDVRIRSGLSRWQTFLAGVSWRRWGVAGAVAAVAVASIWTVTRPEKSQPRPDVARIEMVSGQAERVVGGRAMPVTVAGTVSVGDFLRVGSNGAVSLAIINGTRLEAGPDTELSSLIPSPQELPRWKMSRGILSAHASPLVPLRLETPHLSINATDASLNIEASADATWLHVTTGTALVSRATALSISVAPGQIVKARSDEPKDAPLIVAAFERDMLRSPFNSSSPWNTPIGSGAMPARIRAPGWPPQNVSNAVIVRPIFISRQGDPRVNFFSSGEQPRPIPYPDSWNPVFTPGEFVCGLFPQDRLVCEMTEPVRLPSRDVRARERNSTDLTGHGVGWSWPYPRSIGGSAFAGLIRRGELTFGIQHALALAVNSRYLNATGGVDGHRWPGVPVAPELVATFGQQGNLVIGALLVIPPRVDLASLNVGTVGPGFEIARALQDYGAYIIQTTDGNVKLIAAPDAGLPPDIDEIVNRLVPRLVLVSNNSLRNVGGGGERRRHPAAPLAL